MSFDEPKMEIMVMNSYQNEKRNKSAVYVTNVCREMFAIESLTITFTGFVQRLHSNGSKWE